MSRRWPLLVLVSLAMACAHRGADVHEAPTLAIVPGCPTEADGRLSFCLWRRVIWASLLYQEGRVERFITSGDAVYNRYPEARALKAGMVALGIPAEAIFLETQALHTDENIGYSLHLAQGLGFNRFAVASDRGQALGGCVMLRRWGHPCEVMSVDIQRVHDRRIQPLPDVVIEAVPSAAWIPLEEKERRRAAAEGRRRRPRSLPYYISHGVLGVFGLSGPPSPPVTESTGG